MSFFRPQAMAELTRWRGAIAAGVVLAFGLLWGVTGLGLIRWIGWTLVLFGAVLLWASVQRARFQGGHGGVGLVEIDERQITYLAPAGGGFASIEALTEISIAPDRAGLAVWRLKSGIELLTIPAAAEGTEALFDVLTALPGVDIEAAIRASRSRPDDTTVIWRKPPRRLG